MTTPATIQEILSKEGYSIEGLSNRKRSVRNINSVLKNSDVTIAVCEKGKVWNIENVKFNIKISLPGTATSRFYVKELNQHTDIPFTILKLLAKFLRRDVVKAKIYSETEVPCKCMKCDGAGVIPAFYYYADGVCFDCMGVGVYGKLIVQNVQDRAKRELKGRPYLQKFFVSANYQEVFPKDVENIKAIAFVGHPTAEQFLGTKEDMFYIHQPVCQSNSWYAVPSNEFDKFKTEYNKFFNSNI